MKRSKLEAASLLLCWGFGCSPSTSTPSSTPTATSGGSGGAGHTSGAGGANVEIGSSTLPAPPSDGHLPRPDGAATGLKVLDWAGFKSAISYTFDDTNSSQIDHYAKLQALNVRMTFYLITSKVELSDPVWEQVLEDGHEIGNHTHTHQMSDDGADTDRATELIQETFGITPYTMAAPFGAAVYSELAKTRFFVNRGVSNGLVTPNDTTNPFSLPCYIPPEDAPQESFNSQIERARDANAWRLVLVHGFTGGTDSAYQPVGIDDFVASVEHAKSFGDIWLDSVENVAAYWQGQKAFSNAKQSSSGDEQTWTWTLPEHFPPNKYLRVTVAGGTLSQIGTELTWNDEGYYEVALDALSLTLSP